MFKVYLFGLFFTRKPANLSKDGISTVSLWSMGHLWPARCVLNDLRSPTAAILRSQTRRLPHHKAVTIPGPCVESRKIPKPANCQGILGRPFNLKAHRHTAVQFEIILSKASPQSYSNATVACLLPNLVVMTTGRCLARDFWSFK